MGENLSEADLDKLLNESDTDKDGQINYEEFIRMLLWWAWYATSVPKLIIFLSYR